MIGIIEIIESEHDERQTMLQEAMDHIFELDAEQEDTDTVEQDDPVALEKMLARVQEIFQGDGESANSSNMKEIEDCFNRCVERTRQAEESKEFELIEEFVLAEENLGRQRRSKASRLDASEEKRLAADVAQLKGDRSLMNGTDTNQELQISDAERAYVNRKMVFAKAAQLASAECRTQFARVREFFKNIHNTHQDAIYLQHKRTLEFQELSRRLRGTDTRVASLETQITKRLFQKRKSDLNELHMAQTLEEGVYLDAMMDLLDSVQATKEKAAFELFVLRVSNLKALREAQFRRDDEVARFRASATLQLAKLAAQYVEEDADDETDEGQAREKVEAMERRKQFGASSPDNKIILVINLYEAVVWSAVTSRLGLSSFNAGSPFSDSCTDSLSDIMADDPREGERIECMDTDQESSTFHFKTDASSMQEYLQPRLLPSGKMHMKHLAKELRAKERSVTKKHNTEMRWQRNQYLTTASNLKRVQQGVMDKLLEKCNLDTQILREAITERMKSLVSSQETSAALLQKNDTHLMEEAIRAEDKRLADAETSFVEAQELISAQVFHEVRNALSSVVAMKEMTTSLKEDTNIPPAQLLSSVDEMLNQSNDVVNYALKMLNNTLDISKMNSGAFRADIHPFELQEVMTRATRMQLAKAGDRLKMSFRPGPHPMIAVSDGDIIERLMVTLISNAVKFTSTGAVQTFIWPVEGLSSDASSDDANKESAAIKDARQTFHSELKNAKMKMVAVGVADTGPGLTEAELRSALSGIRTSLSKSSAQYGVQNTGFGLYHAHLQAKALNTKLQLSTLEHCRGLLNQDMLAATMESKRTIDVARNNIDNPVVTCSPDDGDEPSHALDDAKRIGQGTIIYFTIPVLDDTGSYNALRVKNAAQVSSPTRSDPSSSAVGEEPYYTFCPRPSPNSTHGSFRILVADDVLMLRKGLVHTIENLWSTKYPNCPVSICTACSAEDVLRCAESQPFDLIISDHFFDIHISTVNQLSAEELVRHGRPYMLFDNKTKSRKLMRKYASDFFRSEQFTAEEGDGSLLGLGALTQLADEAPSAPFPTPLLMLLSGHKIENLPNPSIIVSQKPLKELEFVPLLEAHALHLLTTGQLLAGSSGEVLVNLHGSPIFVRRNEE